MKRCGFIFSLDAFVAFTIITITVSLLIFIIGVPKGYYSMLEQAHLLSFDCLQVLSTSSFSGFSPPTYLDIILSNSPGHPLSSEIMRNIVGGSTNVSRRPIIPKGYGFVLEDFDFSTDSWRVLYNSSADPLSDRFGKAYSKLQASSTIFVSSYSVPPSPGESMYCYISCKGYQPDGSYRSTCDVTPCSRPLDNFGVGANSLHLVKLTVFA
ncbi:MAG: hypothetical protein N3G22_01400 [Candidatus Micrarchaeota archaeon]|nr:hypothetical protein [Candidatus Micrarchaeota archaeon]